MRPSIQLIFHKLWIDSKVVTRSAAQSTTASISPLSASSSAPVSAPDAPSAKHILILGWGGSHLRSMEKVSDFYLKQGISTTSFIMPLGIPHFVRMALLEEVVKTLPKEIDKDANSSWARLQPLYVHAFSNNGIWSYASLCMLLDTQQHGGQIKASSTTTDTGVHHNKHNQHALPVQKLILDSGPHVFYTPWSMSEEVYVYARVITSVILGRAQYEHSLISPIIRSILYIGQIFHRIVRFVQYTVPVLNDCIVPPYLAMNVYLRDSTPMVPTLFLYSKDDGLVPPVSVEQYAADLKQRYRSASGNGNDTSEPAISVRIHSFTGVEHTAPFFAKSTRDEYYAVVKAFLGI